MGEVNQVYLFGKKQTPGTPARTLLVIPAPYGAQNQTGHGGDKIEGNEISDLSHSAMGHIPLLSEQELTFK